MSIEQYIKVRHMDAIQYKHSICNKTHFEANNASHQCLRMEVDVAASSHRSAWTHRLDTQQGYDLHCTVSFKNLSAHRRAWFKSELVDWDIPSRLLAQVPWPVMNAAIICWCMKSKVHHHLRHIQSWRFLSGLVIAALSDGRGVCAAPLSGLHHLHASGKQRCVLTMNTSGKPKPQKVTQGTESISFPSYCIYVSRLQTNHWHSWCV